MPTVQSPLSPVGDDDPLGDPFLERRDDRGAGVFVRRVLIVVMVGPIKPTVPGVDERGRERLAGGVGQQVVGLGLRVVGRLVRLGLETQQLEQRLEEFVADRLLALVAPTRACVAQELFDLLKRLRGVIGPGGSSRRRVSR